MNKEQICEVVFERFRDTEAMTSREVISLAFDAGVEYAKKGTKPSIDWSHVHSDFKALARAADGVGYIYTARPEPESFSWRNAGDEVITANYFASYDPGTCDWKDSLVERPEGV